MKYILTNNINKVSMDDYHIYKKYKMEHKMVKKKILELQMKLANHNTKEVSDDDIQKSTSHNEKHELCSISDAIIRDVLALSDKVQLKGSVGVRKILTYKISHSDDNEKVIKNLLECNTDIICLQRVTKELFKLIEHSMKKKYLFFEKSEQVEWDQRGKSTTLILSKIIPNGNRSFIYSLIGEQKTSCNIADFGSFVLVNCCLQGGHTKESYAKCRVQMMKYINDILNDEFRGKSIVWVGNFNFDASQINSMEMVYLKGIFENIVNDEHQKYSLMITRGNNIKKHAIDFIKMDHCQGMMINVKINA